MRAECEQGWALPVVLVVIVVVLAAASLLMHRATALERIAKLERQADVAFYGAEAGLEKVVAWTYASGGFCWTEDSGAANRRMGHVSAVFPGESTVVSTYELDWESAAPGTPCADSDDWMITSTGHAGEARRTLRAKVFWVDGPPGFVYVTYEP